jgi:hypothetical protein
MRGYALAIGALLAFFVALGLWVSGLAFRRVDALVAGVFGLGTALALGGYLGVATHQARRIAVVALGLNAAALILLLVISL